MALDVRTGETPCTHILSTGAVAAEAEFRTAAFELTQSVRNLLPGFGLSLATGRWPPLKQRTVARLQEATDRLYDAFYATGGHKERPEDATPES